jgi:hypothetical protein
MSERLKMLENLLEEFYELEKAKPPFDPTNPLSKIVEQIDVANLEIVKIIQEEIEKELK